MCTVSYVLTKTLVTTTLALMVLSACSSETPSYDEDITATYTVTVDGNEFTAEAEPTGDKEYTVKLPAELEDSRRWVAISSDGDERAMYSRDGELWELAEVPEQNYWREVVYATGMDKFIAVSYDGEQRIMVSENGESWTGLESPVQNTWQAIAYSPDLNRVVAASMDGDSRIMYSDDGVNWEAVEAGDQGMWHGLTYSEDLGLFVAVAFDGPERAMVSPDGINWEYVQVPEIPWHSVAYNPQSQTFAAVAYEGPTRSMFSTDGYNWETSDIPTNANWHAIGSGDGQFVAVSFSGSQPVATSPDGRSWTAHTALPASAGWHDVSYSDRDGTWTAVSFFPDSQRVMSSTDGVNWEAKSSPVVADVHWHSLIFGGAQGIAQDVAASGSLVSSNGAIPIESVTVSSDNLVLTTS